MIKCNSDKNCSFKECFFCFAAVLLWSFIAHGFVFFNGTFSHDSLNEFDAEYFGNSWKIQLGRVFVPAYRFIARDMVTMPWIIGILSLVFIGITLILIVKIFDIKSYAQIAIISGILTVNITVISQAATYINDLDCNMLALLMATLAVYLWKKYKCGYLLGMIPVAVSLGLYQSYISVTIMLILICCILYLLECCEFLQVLKCGIRSLVMIVGGGVLYFISMKTILLITDLSLVKGEYNSLDSPFGNFSVSFLSLVKNEYIYTLQELITVPSAYPHRLIVLAHVVIICGAGILIIYRLFSKQIGIKEKVLVLVLIFIMPIGMNVSYIISGGMSHDLMHYALWLVYLFIVLIAGTIEYNGKYNIRRMVKRIPNILLMLIVVVIVWGNVQLANEVYMKKSIEKEENIAYFNRVIYSLENYEEYEKDRLVAFIGTPAEKIKRIPGFESAYQLTGSDNPYMLGGTNTNRCRAFFSYVLPYNINLLDEESRVILMKSDEVKDMPNYPDEGSIKTVGDVIVVKLGDVEN